MKHNTFDCSHSFETEYSLFSLQLRKINYIITYFEKYNFLIGIIEIDFGQSIDNFVQF